MVRSGLKPVRRRKPQKIPVYLTFDERYEVACAIMANVSYRQIAEAFNVSLTCVHHIKEEFTYTPRMWRLDKIATQGVYGAPGTPVPGT